MVATKWFSNNTSDNVRHSAVKSLYAECFAVYYRGCHLKETFQNRLLLTSEKSLTMKQPRSLPNNSDSIFSVSFSVQFSIALRSVLVRFSIGSRLFFDRFSIDSRSSFVHPPFILRSGIEDWSKNERRIIGGKTEKNRNSNGNQGKDDPNKNFIFYHLNSNYYGKTYPWLYHFSASSHSAYWKSMSYVKLMGGFGWCIDEVRSNSPLLWYRILI